MFRYEVKYTSAFKKDYKLAQKRGYDIVLLDNVIKMLGESGYLPAQYNDHALKGEYKGCRECHITPDWLLVYKINDNALILTLTRTGTHSDLF